MPKAPSICGSQLNADADRSGWGRNFDQRSLGGPAVIVLEMSAERPLTANFVSVRRTTGRRGRLGHCVEVRS
jgi:hypothetical protein